MSRHQTYTKYAMSIPEFPSHLGTEVQYAAVLNIYWLIRAIVEQPATAAKTLSYWPALWLVNLLRMLLGDQWQGVQRARAGQDHAASARGLVTGRVMDLPFVRGIKFCRANQLRRVQSYCLRPVF
jgi:hypothetical protein